MKKKEKELKELKIEKVEKKQYDWGFIITLSVICLILGLMFTMQFRTIKKDKALTEQTRTTDIQAKYTELKKDYEDALLQIEEKDKTLKEYRESASGENAELIKKELDNALMSAGLTEVTGTGIIVTLDDSKLEENSGFYVDQNDYLVHDEDILLVVNELRGAGAEAISINEKRLLDRSEIRCAGNNILINGERVAPPFVIKAIGDSAMLESGLTMRGGIVDRLTMTYDLQVNITRESAITIPKYNKPLTYKFATNSQVI